eukprot:15025510-Alexandrium_andersonii.AAC.1
MDHTCKMRIFEGRLVLASCNARRCKSQRKFQRKLRGQPRCRSIYWPKADRGECTCAARTTCAAACAATCGG